ncbi:MAG: sarcosine oxidase subunit gamma family protein [Pseudomonadota bacterium]
MSESASALGRARNTGFAIVEEIGLRGMITLRGDLSSIRLRSAVTDLTHVDFPVRGTCVCSAGHGIAWMSPDEILVMCPHDAAGAETAALRKRLEGSHHLVVDVSDARAVFCVRGDASREVIAKLAPVDLHPDSFKPGMFRRTRLAQISAAFWMRDETVFELICFRSVARYVFDLLTTSAKSGAEVGYFQSRSSR